MPSSSMGFWVARTKNGPVHRVGDPLDRDLQLLHRLQQGRLSLRRRAVDLVGQQDVGEDRPLDERQLPPARGDVFLDDVGAGDVGRHQVRGELDALEPQVEDLRQRLDQQGLGQPGHAGDHGMPPHHQRDHDLLHDALLRDDDLAQLAENLAVTQVQPLHQCFVVCHRLLHTVHSALPFPRCGSSVSGHTSGNSPRTCRTRWSPRWA